MRSRYQFKDPYRAHFITCSIVEWLPVFTTGACCNILVDSLNFCRSQKGLKIHAWVILDNHFHAIISGPELSHTVTDLKKFTARSLLFQVESEGRKWLLNLFAYFRKAHKKMSDFQVWQEGSHPQAISSDEMMYQKIDYVHNNPVKRGLVLAPQHWRYSSAHEWLPGAVPLLKCDPWR